MAQLINKIKYLGIAFFIVYNTDVHAQCTGSVFGPSTTWTGVYESYSGPCSSCNWYATGGNVDFGNGTQNVTVIFNSTGTQTVGYEGSSCKEVEVLTPTAPAAPPTPNVVINQISGCNTTQLEKNGSPSESYVQWYWQGTNSGGVSTNSNANTPYPVTSQGTYYIRARHTKHGLWSSATAVTVSTSQIISVPSSPQNPNINVSTNTCGQKTVTISNSPPSNVKWYWQTSTSGTSTNNIWYNTLYVSSSATYYLRTRHTSDLDCWGSGYTSVSVVVNNYPATPPAPTGPSSACGNVVLSRSNPPGGVTYYWQTSSSGTSTSNSSSSYSVSSSGTQTIYLRARNSAGCWSGASSKTVTVNSIPGQPLPTHSLSSNTCGDRSISITSGSPPSGVNWYWQGTNSNGTSTSLGQHFSSYNVSTTGNYYLRAKNSSANCWSNSSYQIHVDVGQIPSQPPAPTGASVGCGSITLSRSNPPGGVTYYWQTSNTGEYRQFKFHL